MFPRIINNTGYSTPALKDLVAFALPEYLKRDDADPWLQFISFRYKPWNWDTTTAGAYTADRKIIIYLPDVIEVKATTNRHDWETIGGDDKSAAYVLPKSEQLKLDNITEYVLSVIAHELHHLYIDEIGASTPMRPLSSEERTRLRVHLEKEAERYAVQIIQQWRKANGQNSEDQRLRYSAYSKSNVPKFLIGEKN